YVKICGIRDEATLRASRGADAVGFVVDSPKSHRDLTHDEAADLVWKSGPFQVTVAVTATRDRATLATIAREVRPHALQAPRRARDRGREAVWRRRLQRRRDGAREGRLQDPSVHRGGQGEPGDLMRPDARGYYGDFGGRFVPETLMPALEELEAAYAKVQADA